MTKCMVKNKSGKCAKNIMVLGRRWHQKTYGNTYHTSEVWVDGEWIGKSGIKYGYDDMYEITAIDILMDNGLMKTKNHYDALNDVRRYNAENNYKKYTATAIGVDRKSDL
jgi:hypothetical protein